MQSLQESAIKHINEKYVNFFRNRPAYTLGQIDYAKAKNAVNANHNDSLKEVEYSKKKYKVSDIKPSQKQIIVTKVLCILFYDYLQNDIPDEMPLIVSQDGYLIDGHHRWAAAVLANPEKEIEIYEVKLDRDHLISVLNVVTAGYLDKVGNSARGNISNLNRKFIAKIIQNALDGNSSKLDADVVEKNVRKLNINNLDKLITDVPEGSLERQDMPVIDNNDVIEVLELLKSGKIDFSVF